MKKSASRRLKIKKILYILGVSITAVFLICIILCFHKIYKSFTSIDMIKGEECIRKIRSPDSRYEAQVFRNNGGATTDYAVLVVLVDLKSRTEKNIFWEYHCDKAEIEWHSKNKIEINGIVLKVPNEVYDYRKE